MRVSWGITACIEIEELTHLLSILIEGIGYRVREDGSLETADEVVVLVDTSKHDESHEIWFRELQNNFPQVKWVFDKFEGHFADWKNKLNSYCTGDFICQLDADEEPSTTMVVNLHRFLEVNPTVDLYTVPRDNRVEGITVEDIQKWGWRMEPDGRINWPDLQGRVYRNRSDIRWEGKVHEKIVGAQVVGSFYGVLQNRVKLMHNKKIEKQRRQNDLYSSMV